VPARYERALGAATGKIVAADTAVSGMRTESRSGSVVIGVENVPAMAATAHATMNDERHDNGVICGFLNLRAGG